MFPVCAGQRAVAWSQFLRAHSHPEYILFPMCQEQGGAERGLAGRVCPLPSRLWLCTCPRARMPGLVAFTLVGSSTASPNACSLLVNFLWMETLTLEMAQIDMSSSRRRQLQPTNSLGADTWVLSNMFVSLLLNCHNCSSSLAGE